MQKVKKSKELDVIIAYYKSFLGDIIAEMGNSSIYIKKRLKKA